MNKLSILIFSPVVVILSCFIVGESKHVKRRAIEGNGFAVVELFTSEGCSSCPPADEAVIQLARNHPSRVYVLGYHVDYWNYIGWTDPYSNAAFSERQRHYADQFDLNGVYTPQVVVNGKKEFVGSNKGLLESTVTKELGGKPSTAIKLAASKENDGSIAVQYDAGEKSGAELHIALVQTKAETSVKRGENRGRLLEHINVVRELITIGAGKTKKGTTSFAVPRGVAMKELKLIAFLQDKNNGEISAAGDAVIL